MTEYNGMKVGDLIITYHTGIWRLDSIEDRGATKPLAHYTFISSFHGKLSTSKNPKIQRCDISFCFPAQRFIDELEQQLAAVKSVINQK